MVTALQKALALKWYENEGIPVKCDIFGNLYLDWMDNWKILIDDTDIVDRAARQQEAEDVLYCQYCKKPMGHTNPTGICGRCGRFPNPNPRLKDALS